MIKIQNPILDNKHKYDLRLAFSLLELKDASFKSFFAMQIPMKGNMDKIKKYFMMEIQMIHYRTWEAN